LQISNRIAAGKLRHRIDLLKPSVAQDQFGGTDESAANLFATVWASIEAVSAGERFAGEQITSVVSHRITIRWRAGVGSDMYVSFDGRQFQIQAVQNPDERHKMLVLPCLERDDSSRERPSTSPS
jgi:SPP1 family predicted phage head-tail adaptor